MWICAWLTTSLIIRPQFRSQDPSLSPLRMKELESGNQVEKALDKAFHHKTWVSSLTFYLGAEVYERLNRRREEDKSRRKMLDDILANIQVKFQKWLETFSRNEELV